MVCHSWPPAIPMTSSWIGSSNPAPNIPAQLMALKGGFSQAAERETRQQFSKSESGELGAEDPDQARRWMKKAAEAEHARPNRAWRRPVLLMTWGSCGLFIQGK